LQAEPILCTPHAAVDADAIAKLIRDLEREGLHAVDASRPVRPLGRSSKWEGPPGRAFPCLIDAVAVA
jgi:hypothetical protein